MQTPLNFSKDLLTGKSILITGGTGSFGKAFTKYVCENFKPRKLIIFSRDELKQFEMSQNFSNELYPFLRYFIGDIRDKERLARAFYDVDYVIHAAAIKQVPTAEYNPSEAIKTNVNGAMNIVDVSIDCNIKKVVALSTDKACNPINLYGATKLCSEKLFISGNAYSGIRPTRFSVVRYGNVVGSRGSIVPFFRKVRRTGTIPVTDDRMTRFWITLDRGVEMVLMALDKMQGGEIFVPKIPSMKVTDLAHAVAPECKTKIVGIRPGEKIHESLISEEEARTAFEFQSYYVIEPQMAFWGERKRTLDEVGERVRPGFYYASNNNKDWLDGPGLKKILDNNIHDAF